MRKVIEVDVCDWCAQPLAVNEWSNDYSDGQELCPSCADQKALAIGLARGVASGRSAKEAIRSLLDLYEPISGNSREDTSPK